MSLSNQKPASARETPHEPFKRAVAGCLRAMARAPDLEISFAPDKPGVIGTAEQGKARLPEPPRRMDARDAAILRGQADSMALRLACHDVRTHSRLAPQAPTARAIFDAMEQARVEAIGALRMEGVGQNFSAALEDRYERNHAADVRQRSDAPLEDALALLVREKLTGRAPPKAAARLVELWRDSLETRAGSDLARLAEAIQDQRSFAKLTRKILVELDMSEQGDADQQDDEEADGDDEAGSDQPEEKGGDEKKEFC